MISNLIDYLKRSGMKGSKYTATNRPKSPSSRFLPRRLELLERFERLNPEKCKETINDSNKLSMVHPGRIILEEFLAPKGISVFRLAKEIGVSPRRIYEIVQGQRSINADIAHRFAHYFGMSERYWLDLQARYDGRQDDKLSKELPRKQSLRYAG